MTTLTKNKNFYITTPTRKSHHHHKNYGDEYAIPERDPPILVTWQTETLTLTKYEMPRILDDLMCLSGNVFPSGKFSKCLHRACDKRAEKTNAGCNVDQMKTLRRLAHIHERSDQTLHSCNTCGNYGPYGPSHCIWKQSRVK